MTFALSALAAMAEDKIPTMAAIKSFLVTLATYANSLIFAAMMKSFSCRPEMLWVQSTHSA